MHFIGPLSISASLRTCLLLVCWLIMASQVALADPPPRGYYLISEVAQAEQDAKAHHLPLVWMSSDVNLLTEQNPTDDQYDLSQMACSYLTKNLYGRVVLIVFYNSREIGQVPATVAGAMNQVDDPGLEGTGTNYAMPKLVITNGDATEVFGRVSYTQMKKSREIAIYDLIHTIYTTPEIKAKLLAQTVKETPIPDDPFAPKPTATPTPKPAAAASNSGSYTPYITGVAVLVVGMAAYITYMQKKQGK